MQTQSSIINQSSPSAAAHAAMAATTAAAPSPAQVLRFFPDAVEDSCVAAYALLVVAPIVTLASEWLKRGGKLTSPFRVLIVSVLVPTILFGFPAISRAAPRNIWGTRYAYWRDLYRSGEMPPEIWAGIDAAYDNIFDEKARVVYDFWGSKAKDMTLLETQFNVCLFYILWYGIVYVLTSSKANYGASKWSYTGLIVLLGFEMAVRLLKYEPSIKKMFPFITPREFVLWAHRLFPVFVFALVALKRTFFVDMDLHRQRVLQHALEQNQKAMADIQALERELLSDDYDDDDADDAEAESTEPKKTK
ncbi:TPA: hypothetical protein N0F65_008774 [Lagenidium giganteum]|uniref:Uncharacterized protein n=1 Tax=Lagenidium giganteum TaxID=4803 RepID=A0AAV2YY31_9STRA|nr:TPA: hypothetical protein N0F65_008774 [Lagenidium giganteum]